MVSFFSNIPRAMVIIGHELFHIHFHIYFWDEIEKEIGYSKTDDLKEALTVLLKNKLVKLKQEDLEKRCRERTLILCKPESILTGEYPEILRRIQRLHFKTPLLKMFKFSKKSVIEFYKEVVNNWEPKEDMIEIFTKMIEYP